MHAEMDMRNTTLVIGAGPAGLAAAGELRRAGVPAFVLERADAIGASWRGRYDRLRLNTSRLTSRLPKTRYPPARHSSLRRAAIWARATGRRERRAQSRRRR
jgi:cation diffusion facilitator CzcD-associated flavoprotein CzcO